MSNIMSAAERFRSRTLATVRSLNTLDGVTVMVTDKQTIYEICIEHRLMFVPDFKLKWSEDKQHYLAYAFISPAESIAKESSGKAIAALPNMFAVIDFINMYRFLCKYRANKKVDG